MRGIFAQLRRLAAGQHRYFAECGEEIALRNLLLMRNVCCMVIVVYAAVYVVTRVFFPAMAIAPAYALVVAAMAGFFAYASRALRRQPVHVRAVFRASMALYVCMMASVIVLSVFPHPDVPSVYYPLYIMMAPLLFMLPAAWHLTGTAVSLAVFWALVLRFKAPACWQHELFEATLAAVLSVFVVWFTLQYRVQTDVLKDKYYHLSRVDTLTGTLTRAAAADAAAQLLTDRRRRSGCALLFLDVDHFKRINDTCGHTTGDAVLRKMGALLLQKCRRDDVVSRFGGDEFVLLLRSANDPDAVQRKAQAILQEVRRTQWPVPGGVTCSIGISLQDGQTFAQMLQTADAALYEAKTAGRDRCALCRAPADSAPQAGAPAAAAENRTENVSAAPAASRAEDAPAAAAEIRAENVPAAPAASGAGNVSAAAAETRTENVPAAPAASGAGDAFAAPAPAQTGPMQPAPAQSERTLPTPRAAHFPHD